MGYFVSYVYIHYVNSTNRGCTVSAPFHFQSLLSPFCCPGRVSGRTVVRYDMNGNRDGSMAGSTRGWA